MKSVQVVCLLFALGIVGAILFHASHGRLGVFLSTEGFLGLVVAWLLTVASCGTPGVRSLIAVLCAKSATDEQRQQAALVLETSGRLAHGMAACLGMVSLIIMFEHLGSDVSAIGGALAITILMFLYATLYSELIAAPLHTSIAPNIRWSLTPLIASGLIVLAVLASFGFGVMTSAFERPGLPPTS